MYDPEITKAAIELLDWGMFHQCEPWNPPARSADDWEKVIVRAGEILRKMEPGMAQHCGADYARAYIADAERELTAGLIWALQKTNSAPSTAIQ